jgi:membrane fusion protein, multidrug efflux system
MKIYFSISLLAFSFLLACQTGRNAEHDEAATPGPASIAYVKTADVQVGSASSSIRSLGTIVSKTVAKPAFKTGGVVDRTFFREGDLVREGQLLATLLMTEIEAQVNQAREGVRKAERDLERVSNLYTDSVATLEQQQNAGTALELARQSLEIAEFNQKHSEVRAPISGKIISQLLHEGEIAGPGIPVGVIMGITSKDWRIKTGLVDREWSRVKTGDPATIQMDAYPHQTFQAVVSDKAVQAMDASGTLDVELTFRQSPPSLAAGMLCKVELEAKHQEALTTIPIEALVNSNGSIATVFTLEQGKAKKLSIIIDRILGDRVVVSSGLEGVSQVVTIGSVYLEEGDQVSIAQY